MIPQDVIEEILRLTSLVDIMSPHVHLKKSGHDYKGLCPFHNDKKNPSLHVNDQKGLYHCFTCGAGGNVLTFLKEYQKLDFIDALKFLGEKAGINVDSYLNNQDALPLRNKIKTMHQLAQEYFLKNLYTIDNPQTELAVRTLKRRKLDKNTIQMFGLGFGGTSKDGLFKYIQTQGFLADEIIASGLCGKNDKGYFYDRFRNRITFPIFDSDGSIIAFGGRIIDNSSPAKYINSPETLLFKKGTVLYAWNFAKEIVSERGHVILVEGYMDVIRMFQAGFSQTVAPLGTGLTENRIQYLKNKVDNIILCFDGDNAGQKSAYRSAGIAARFDIPTKIAILPSDKDPDTFLIEQGIDKMAEILDHSIDAEVFVLESAQQYLPNSNKFLQEIFEYALSLEGEGFSPSLTIKTEQFLKKATEILQVSFSAIEIEFSRFKQDQNKPQEWNKAPINNNKELKDESELIAILIMYPEFIDHAAQILDISDFQDTESQEFFKLMLLHPEFEKQDWLHKAANSSFIQKTSKWLNAPDIRILQTHAISIRMKSLKIKRDTISRDIVSLDKSSSSYQDLSQDILSINQELIELKQDFYRL